MTLGKRINQRNALARLRGESQNNNRLEIQMTNSTKRIGEWTVALLTILLCCLSCPSCGSRGGASPNRNLAADDLSLYRKTNDEAGHELVKTEEFLVPVGSVIVLKGLEFEPGVATLTRTQERIVQQVFNSLEEITENTVGDTNSTRVAEFMKLKLEVRGYSDGSGSRESKLALAEARAKAVMHFLTSLGTPAWRLKASGIETEGATAANAGVENGKRQGRVEFVRTR